MSWGLPQLTVVAALMSSACVTSGDSGPAVLVDFDEDTRATVAAVIGEELGRGRIEFGAGDPTAEPVISVLPRRPGPLETNSPASPVMFDILTGAEGCFLQMQGTRKTLPLKGVACRAVSP